MTKHIHYYNFRPCNRWSVYDIDIFQCAYDEICLTLQNTLYQCGGSVQFDITIKPGNAYKINAASITTPTGKAADFIEWLTDHKEEAAAIAQTLVFNHPKRSKTLGL